VEEESKTLVVKIMGIFGRVSEKEKVATSLAKHKKMCRPNNMFKTKLD
jgi:hypothetical protein